MEKMKCSFQEHKENDAIIFCCECKIYMCNKCQKNHSGLFINHNLYNLDKDLNDIFTSFCKEENHYDKLEFYCKNHNVLCCSACIVKVKKKGKGQHSNCDVCIIEDIKTEKKNILEKNLNELEDLSKSLKNTINEIKKEFEKMNKDKEELKTKIQKIFTEIRNQLNNREDELLLKVDEEYDKLIYNQNKIKELEKLPNKVKISLEKGKNIDENYNDDNKLSLFIHDCLNIEKNIKDIKLINSNNTKENSINIKFIPEEKGINEFLNTIKRFGDISKFCKNYLFTDSPIKLNNLKDYSLSGENKNIITKIGPGVYRGTLILNELGKNKVHSWKIKLLKSYDHFHFYVGVASSDFDINNPPSNCGWYYYIYCSRLESGPPHKLYEIINSKKAKIEITVIMDMNKRTLKFLIDNEDRGELYTDIPIDKPLYPAVFMYYTNDSLQFIKC